MAFWPSEELPRQPWPCSPPTAASGASPTAAAAAHAAASTGAARSRSRSRSRVSPSASPWTPASPAQGTTASSSGALLPLSQLCAESIELDEERELLQRAELCRQKIRELRAELDEERETVLQQRETISELRAELAALRGRQARCETRARCEFFHIVLQASGPSPPAWVWSLRQNLRRHDL